jgi:hypothetical protein
VAAKTVTAILSGWFNRKDAQRPLMEWAEELAGMSAKEKRLLAEDICKVTGDTIKDD